MKRKIYEIIKNKNNLTKLKNKTLKSIIFDNDVNKDILYKDYVFSLNEGDIYSSSVNDDALFSSKKLMIPLVEVDFIAHFLKPLDQFNKVEKVICNCFFPIKLNRYFASKKSVERILSSSDLTSSLKKLLEQDKIECVNTIFYNAFKKEMRLYLHITFQNVLDYPSIEKIIKENENSLMEIEFMEKDKYCEFAFYVVLKIKSVYKLRKKYFLNTLEMIDMLIKE